MTDNAINRRGFLRAAGLGAMLAGAAANSTKAAGQIPAPECCTEAPQGMDEVMGQTDFIRLITLDPAHFHAALVQKKMLPEISKRVAVYAPLGTGLLAHLQLIEEFNTRPVNPTNWELDIHCSHRSLEEMLAAKPGNVVVLAGHNRTKIEKIKASVDAKLNVLSDKPWIIRAEDFPLLESVFSVADRKGLVAYDMMTERYEITTILQREMVNDPAVFGAPIPADRDHPAVFMESTHHILKTVAGNPYLRPPYFFDILDQGEGLADVGTHLVDLAQWTLFPNQAIDYRHDIQVEAAKRWATPITLEQYRQVTDTKSFPGALSPYIHGDRFDYYCNNQVDYKIRGAQVQLRLLWKWVSPAGVDFHHAIYRGTNASVEVRQTAKENYRRELYVAAANAERREAIAAAVRAKVKRLQETYPGVGVAPSGDELRITIPDRYRVGHEAHFAMVVEKFVEYMKSPKSMPEWEQPNMLAKYYVTTTGTEMGHSS
ncbi:MAG TPA: putative oxidoreductase C-terminal domain-containing protein [Terriglobia bacterium]|nr:putative oxidoreductase C-terminal domain-containing protein [Terriglobia bacterium]